MSDSQKVLENELENYLFEVASKPDEEARLLREQIDELISDADSSLSLRQCIDDLRNADSALQLTELKRTYTEIVAAIPQSDETSEARKKLLEDLDRIHNEQSQKIGVPVVALAEAERI